VQNCFLLVCLLELVGQTNERSKAKWVCSSCKKANGPLSQYLPFVALCGVHDFPPSLPPLYNNFPRTLRRTTLLFTTHFTNIFTIRTSVSKYVSLLSTRHHTPCFHDACANVCCPWKHINIKRTSAPHICNN
jgi:hypothetical protein